MSTSNRQSDQIYIERIHAKAKEPMYIACQDWNFAWLKSEVARVKLSWKAGRPIWEIAAQVRRPQEEVVILILDLIVRRELENRPGGVFGKS